MESENIDNEESDVSDDGDDVDWHPGKIFEPLPPPTLSHSTRASSSTIHEITIF